MTMALGTIWSVTLDCDDPQALGRFWAAALGGTVAHESDNFVGVELPSGMWLGAYRVDDYTRPVWGSEPGDGPGKQFHLDLSVEDLDQAVAAAVELGATAAEHQPEPDRWRVLIDPAGHPFCVTKMS
jgi:catechol 2,3-dioxygenase-like lactoylglutathione lyase family enzyme